MSETSPRLRISYPRGGFSSPIWSRTHRCSPFLDRPVPPCEIWLNGCDLRVNARTLPFFTTNMSGSYSYVGKQVALMDVRSVTSQLLRRCDVALAPGQTKEAFVGGLVGGFTFDLSETGSGVHAEGQVSEDDGLSGRPVDMKPGLAHRLLKRETGVDGINRPGGGFSMLLLLPSQCIFMRAFALHPALGSPLVVSICPAAHESHTRGCSRAPSPWGT